MTLSPFMSNPPSTGGQQNQQSDNNRRDHNTTNNEMTTGTRSPNDISDQQQQSSSSSSSPAQQHYSLLRLLCMFAVSFSYGLVFNTVNNIVIPNEIERLTTSRQSMWVGLIMASGAVSQFATPVAGAWSDRSGDRVKFLLAGSLVTVVGVVGFSVVSSSQSVLLLFFSQIITTVGLSVQYAMVTALLNDHVPTHQAGAGSGALAILGILGSGVGYSLFALNIPSQYSFMCYIGCTIGCVAISTFFIPSPSSSKQSNNNNNNSSSSTGGHLGSTLALEASGAAASSTTALPSSSQPPSTHALRTNNNNSSVTKQQVWGAGQHHNITNASGVGTVAAAPVALLGGGGDATPTRRGSPATPACPNSTKRFATGAADINNIVAGGGKVVMADHMALLPPASYRPKRSHRHALRRLTHGTLQRAEAASSSCLAFFGDMLPSPTKAPDFFFACLGRGLFNCGLSGQVYLVYYLRDIILVHNPIQIASLVAVGALVGGIVGALPAGILSDRIGKKPIIYVAIGVCVVSLMMFLMVSSVNTVQIIGFVYGIGNVGYLSVDYALGVQSLPSTSSSSSSNNNNNKRHLQPHHRNNNNNNRASLSTSKRDVEMGNGGGDDQDDTAEMTVMNKSGVNPGNYNNNHHSNTMDKSCVSYESGSDDEGSCEDDDLIISTTHGELSSLPTNHNTNPPYSGGTDETATTKSPLLASQTVGGEMSCDDQHQHQHVVAVHTSQKRRSHSTNNNTNRRGHVSTTTSSSGRGGSGVRRSGSQSKGATHAGKDLGVFAMSATFGQVAGQLIFGIVLDQFSISSMEPNLVGHHYTPSATTILTTAAVTSSMTTIPTSSTPHQFVGGHHEVIRYTYMGFIVIYSLGAIAFILSGVFTSYIKNVD